MGSSSDVSANRDAPHIDLFSHNECRNFFTAAVYDAD